MATTFPTIFTTDVISNVTVTYDPAVRGLLIAMGSLASITSLYFMIALIVHRVRAVKRKKKEERLRHTEPNSRRSLKRRDTSTPWLDNLSLVSGILAFLNCSSEHTIFYTKYTSNTACKVMQSFSFVFYSLGVACLYSFLWKRQRACYNSPTLAQMHSMPLRVLSAAILPVFLVMMLVGMILTAVIWEFDTSHIGCIETSNSRTPLVVLFAGSVAMQLTLLTLFVYPLRRHYFERSDSPLAADKVLTALVKRSIITTALCIAADALAFTIAMLIPISTPFIVTNLLYDVNLLCNVLCVVGSFADWRQRVAPWCTEDYRTLCDRKSTRSHYTSSVKTSTTVV